jgi:hypothetical protein|tara:strand:- start:48 stop:353 length:306 start_codon:yes stop_codon:yes gene_type:complete
MITATGLEQLGFTPEVDFSLQNDGGDTFISKWMSASPQPAEAEIETAHAEWQAEYDSQAYARNRQTEYPAIGDQLDALFHAGVFPADMAAQLQAVKDKYPR